MTTKDLIMLSFRLNLNNMCKITSFLSDGQIEKELHSAEHYQRGIVYIKIGEKKDAYEEIA